jgi:hypothetical protein
VFFTVWEEEEEEEEFRRGGESWSLFPPKI